MEIVIVALVALVAVAAVLFPILRPAGRSGGPPIADERELDVELARYRAALRAGTLCLDCGSPNPDDSRFCAQCGGVLIASRAEGAATGDEREAAAPRA